MLKRPCGKAALALALGVLALSACGGPPSQREEGETLARVALAPLRTVGPEDVAALLTKEQGKVVVVNVWATWCPPCVAEMPALVAFDKSVNGDEVALIGLSVDDPAVMESEVKPFLQKKGVTFPVYVLSDFDPKAYEPALQLELDGRIPVTLFYDKQGNLKRVHPGALDEAKLKEIVEPLMQ